jgi:hypothetical protein
MRQGSAWMRDDFSHASQLHPVEGVTHALRTLDRHDATTTTWRQV